MAKKPHSNRERTSKKGKRQQQLQQESREPQPTKWTEDRTTQAVIAGLLILAAFLAFRFISVVRSAPMTPATNNATGGQTTPTAAPQAGTSATKTPRPQAKTYDAPPPMSIDAAKHYTATIETAKGNIVLELFPKVAPQTVNSFVFLAREGFYDGLTFHRVVPGFVVQGGDPKGDGTGGPGYTLPAEFSDVKHITGTLAMARTSDPNSAGSQFYITLAPTPHLDGQYTVFGQVREGMDVVQAIRVGDVMDKVTIEEGP